MGKPKYDSMLRRVVLAAMDDQGKTPADVVRMGVRSRNRTYDWLAGKAEMKDSGVSAILEKLGLIIVPIEKMEDAVMKRPRSPEATPRKKAGKKKARKGR